MSPWFKTLLLVVVLTALGKSESVADDNVEGFQTVEGSAGWDSTEFEQLQDRLETLESAVRSIVSAMASQKNEIFAPITAILEQNPALRAILSSSPVFQSVPENSTIHPDFSYNTTTNTNSETDQGEKLIAVNQLKGAVKCSLAQLLDIKVSEKEPNPSGNINASLSRNKSIEIEWTPLSPECIAYNSGVWIRVFESDTPSSGATYLSIPRKCLTEKYNSTFSFAIHSPTKSDDTSKKSDCHFELKNVLIECRSYKVELIPNYESLKGRPLTTEIVIPPTNGNSIDMKSLLNVATSPSSLTLNWKDHSGCAPQLTSFYLKTIPDGGVNAKNETHGSLKFPRTYLKQQRDENNLFSLTLSHWTSLDACRKYSFEMKSEYSKIWSSAPHFWETFTSKEGRRPIDKEYEFRYCSESEGFYCRNIVYHNQQYYLRVFGDRAGCLNKNQLCDGHRDCASGVDEQNCDGMMDMDRDYYWIPIQCSTDGFKCGRQCIPKRKVCDGVYDCVDGSDEHYDCEYAKSCSELKDTSGIVSSLTIDSDNVFKNAAQKTIVAISVQSDQIIWLSFSKFNTKENHLVKVYDGPYSTSPLLLSQSGSIKPSSVRSSLNNLYVEFPSYYDRSYGVSVSYTSMESMGKPFVPGCGGYVYGDGSVSSPNYLSNNNNDLDECFWFLEAGQSDGVIFVKRNHFPIFGSLKFPSELPIMTVYDGWNTSGQVLYDELDSSKPAQAKSVVYSVSQKMMIRFTRPKVSCSSRNWSVTTIPKVSTTTNLVGMTGSIKSPNYPAAYPNFSDYRWKIVTEPGTIIRLLFALFETQEKFDYVFVFDGPTVNSPLLLEKSGLSLIPFAVNSSSNEMLVRFTSDENTTLPGFLALYSTVQIL